MAQVTGRLPSLRYALIKLGLVKRYVRPPKIEPVPTWGIYHGEADNPVALTIELAGGERISVGGPPTGLLERCARALGGRKASPPSEQLLARYAAGWTPETGRSF